MRTFNVDAKDAGKGEREKFINNFSGFFAIKPSSKNPALLQSCKFTFMKVHLCTTRKSREMPFLSKNVGPFHKNCADSGFCLSGRAGELSLC